MYGAGFLGLSEGEIQLFDIITRQLDIITMLLMHLTICNYDIYLQN